MEDRFSHDAAHICLIFYFSTEVKMMMIPQLYNENFAIVVFPSNKKNWSFLINCQGSNNNKTCGHTSCVTREQQKKML